MLKIITLISIIIFWESITMANDSKENDFIMDIVKGETKFILKNNMKQNDFILHLNGRRNGFGVAGTYNINIIFSHKTLSVYLLTKMENYIFDKNGTAIENDISKNETRIFYLNNEDIRCQVSPRCTISKAISRNTSGKILNISGFV